MAAGDQSELIRMIKTSILIDDRPSSFRFPRDSVFDEKMEKDLLPLEIGKGRILQEGNSIALMNFGSRLKACQEAVDFLSRKGLKITFVDARFAKPFDSDLMDNILDYHEYVLTIEEGSIGGFSSIVLDYIHNKRKKNTSSKIQNLIFPDKFINHDTMENQYKEIGMDSNSIEKKILSMLSSKDLDLKAIENI